MAALSTLQKFDTQNNQIIRNNIYLKTYIIFYKLLLAVGQLNANVQSLATS